MNDAVISRAGIVGIACAMLFAAFPASAENAQGASAAPAAAASGADHGKAESKAKQKQTKKEDGKPAKADSNAKPKPGTFSSEAEAKAHCKGEVVWVDSDHFNHYAKSREYGRQPGAFACES